MNVTEIQLCSPGPIVHASFAVQNTNRTYPYILKAATGFDSDEIIKTYNDGHHFFRVRPKQRIVALLIKLNRNYNNVATIGDLRDALYKAISYNVQATIFNSDSKLELRFINNGVYIASLFGFVTKMESNIFSSDPEMQLTIDCQDPFLRSTVITNMENNIDLTPDGAFHINVTERYNVGSSLTYTDNLSTAPHGFKMEIAVVSNVPATEFSPPKMVIWDNRNPSLYLFSAAYDFLAGDKIYFSSEEDNRYIYVESSYGPIPLMDKIYWGSIWPFIWPGDNKVEVSEGLHITKAAHRASYWGV